MFEEINFELHIFQIVHILYIIYISDGQTLTPGIISGIDLTVSGLMDDSRYQPPILKAKKTKKQF